MQRYRQQMEEWANKYGSGRLLEALRSGECPQRIYRSERRDRELPGFLLDPDASRRVEPLRDPTREAVEALTAVRAHLEDWDIEHTQCELVCVPADHRAEHPPGRPAVRVTGWLERHVLIAFVCSRPDTGFAPITASYPDGVRVASGSTLRPTAYGSAYGVKHPAAQEALRHAAVVSIDTFNDFEPTVALSEYLPPDAHDMLDDELVSDFSDTLFLVGWKLGQPVRLALSSLAEQIAGRIIFGEAEGALEMRGETLTDMAYEQAQHDLETGLETVLDEDFLYEYLANVEAFSLADLVPKDVPSRRASLWAPLQLVDGDPPPRITGDDEPEWSLTQHPGMTAREQMRADREQRDAERSMEGRAVTALVARAHWQADYRDGKANLLGELPDGRALVLGPPPAIAGDHHVSAWALDCYATRKAAVSETGKSEEHDALSWQRLFEILPACAHPAAVNVVFGAIEWTMGWATSVGGHALAGGAVEPIRRCADALRGVIAIREQLEQCRLAGVVHDARLTRHGVRHELFGDFEQMRFLAIARFAVPDDRSFAEVQGDFNESIYDFSPLPVSLGIELHPDGDGSACVRCGLGVESIEEAHKLANEVISQVRWRAALAPIDLEDGEQAEEIGFEIIEQDALGESETDD